MVFSSPLKLFQVDSLQKRWVAFLLLILVWGVSFCFFFMPPGDPDFSQIAYWLEDIMEAEDPSAAYEANPITNVVTYGNLVYSGCSLVYLFFLQLVAWFYFVVYSFEKREVPFQKAPAIFLKRIGWMILFEAVAFVPFLLISSILPVVLLFYLPAFFALPGLVILDKKNPFESIRLSFRKTNGHKIAILLEWLLILGLYFGLNQLVYLILNDGSSGICLVQGFLSAYFTLVFGRQMGERYHMITMLNRE